MRYLTLECEHCESTYSIEYNEESVMYATPAVCPFCGEEIDEELEKDFDNEEDDDEGEEEE